MAALSQLVRQGKALYIGLSNYPPSLLHRAAALLRAAGTPCVIHQPRYSLLQQDVADQGLFAALAKEQIGAIPFSPLAGGLLSDRYLTDIPADSRAARDGRFLKASDITPALRQRLTALNAIALQRGQKLSQLALQWVLHQPQVTSVLIGASKTSQIDDAVAIAAMPVLTEEEVQAIADCLVTYPS